MQVCRLVIPSLVALAASLPSDALAPAAVGELIERLDEAVLQAGAPLGVRDVELRTGPGRLRIRDGLLFPAGPVAGRPVEFVLIGEATLAIEPPDAIEAAQLEMFTGRPHLEEPVRRAVLVVCADAEVDRLMSREPVDADPGLRREAEALFERWRRSPERRHLDVAGAIFTDALEKRFGGPYFAGWFDSERLGEFLLVVDPDADEQVTLGQFVPLRGGVKAQRKRERYIHRQQRKGRLIGLEVDDLGKWNTWTSLRAEPPGGAAFEAEHYALDVRIAPDGERIDGTARLRLRALDAGRRVVEIEAFRDVEIRAVRDHAGRELPMLRGHDAFFAALAEPPPAGAPVEIEIDFGGVLIDRVYSNVYRLRDTIGWYPHVGRVDRATYDVTVRYPRRLGLVAAGRRVAAGRDGPDVRWERRVLETPSFAFSFEIGQFDERRLIVGHVDVVVAFDREMRRAPRHVRNEIVRTVRSSLEFYERTFGPYPLDFLTVVTAPRDFSQGLLSFVSLSSHLANEPREAWWLGVEDRRTVIAHEIAHQWWGNLVGFESYRDEWIVEGMASYAAMAWARTLPAGRRPANGPADQWQAALTRTTPDGRPLDSVGPLVLGRRLSSSRAPEAYEAIVYKKGAVVLNMLDHYFGEHLFRRLLGEVVRVSRGGMLSTEDFFHALEEMTGLDLGWFTGQYVYGTGLPEVYYSYEFLPQPDGNWRIRGQVRQRPPLHYRFRVVELPGGQFDIRRDAEPTLDISDSRLVVPVRIGVYDPGPGSWSGRKRLARSAVVGRLLQKDEVYEFEVEIGYEPHDFQLDPEGVVFGRFFSEHASPKRALMYEAFDAAASGDLEQAERKLLAALDSHVSYDEQPRGRVDGFLLDWESRYLDATIQANLAWIFMDLGRIEDARQRLRLARQTPDAFTLSRIEDSLDLLEARLDILQGEFQRPYRRLRRELLAPHDPLVSAPETGRTEAFLLLAIAARALDETEDQARAVAVAERRGADVSALTSR